MDGRHRGWALVINTQRCAHKLHVLLIISVSEREEKQAPNALIIDA